MRYVWYGVAALGALAVIFALSRLSGQWLLAHWPYFLGTLVLGTAMALVSWHVDAGDDFGHYTVACCAFFFAGFFAATVSLLALLVGLLSLI